MPTLKQMTVSPMQRHGLSQIAAIGIITALLVSPTSGTAAAAVDPIPGAPLAPAAAEDNASELSEDSRTDTVPEHQREDLLGDDWQQSSDVAWTTIGDEAGFHVLAARRDEGYAWHTVSTLGVSSVSTDRWIGNACLSSTGDKLAVVYAPRAATNTEQGLLAGGSAALVDLSSGNVTTIPGSYSLAYFSPSCGPQNSASFTAYDAAGNSNISVFSFGDAGLLTSVTADAQISSAVFSDGNVLGISGTDIVKLDEAGELNSVVDAHLGSYDLTALPDGSIAFVEPDGDSTSVRVVSFAGDAVDSKEVAHGDASVGITHDTHGTLHVLGAAQFTDRLQAENISLHPESDPFATMSTEGDLLVKPAILARDAGKISTDSQASSILIDTQDESSSEELQFEVTASQDDIANPAAESDPPAASLRLSSYPATTELTTQTQTVNTATSPSCAVPRNDPQNQALQPSPDEVEWAVSRAVNGTLTSARPNNWRNLGMPQYTPQGMFPRTPLVGGGRVPIQVMLGILAQESNFWQASRYTVPGVTGNPLVGNYYGTDRESSSADAWWKINFGSADCGYGIAQVTDLMRVGEMPLQQQRAIALDFEANIARGLQILSEKWNQTRSAGMTINNGDPQHIENWFYALWAYNTGFYPKPTTGSDPWGVGWLNNPINPIYPANRKPFLQDSPEDAANPQRWPYQEKVLGFAAHSVQFLKSVDQGPLGDTFNYGTAFAPSWWRATDHNDGKTNRNNVKPPRELFCDSSNACTPGQQNTSGTPCFHRDSQSGNFDLHCWYNKPATWKADCAETCSYESQTYTSTSPRPSAPNSYPPNCSVAGGLPTGALIVDDVPNGTGAVRSGCSAQPTVGSFSFSYAGTSGGTTSPAEVDLHQLGSGFNGHFYFTRERVPGTAAAFGGALNVTGSWNFGSPLNSWGQVYVHMPNHGAWTQQAHYTIETGSRTVERVVNQRNYANTWVSLGTLQFSGTPRITLTNFSSSYDDQLKDRMSGSTDVAWDAVAIVPISQKPAEFVVALGDSYSSGEGTSATDGSGFFRGSDHDGTKTRNSAGQYEDDPQRNACHRSYEAWPYKMTIPSLGSSASVRDLTSSRSPLIDFQLLACAGAETRNVVSRATSGASRQYGEANQIDRGFLDTDTTLVTMTIGGNDVGFGPIIMSCIQNSFVGHGQRCRDAAWTGAGGAAGETTQTYVDKRLVRLKTDVAEAIRQIRQKAPNAKILVQGYPRLFDKGSSCIGIPEDDMPWLNSVADSLNSTLTALTREAGDQVVYSNPQYQFQGSTLCTQDSGITGLVFALTPGDKPIFEWTGPGPNFGAPMSAQSIHPNATGTTLYANSATGALRGTVLSLSGTLVAGAPTTYYATFRYHTVGPASMNVTAAAICSGELRLGLRKQTPGAAGIGEQHTQSLAWSKPDALQNFLFTGSGGMDPNLPTGWYALNARMTDGCPTDAPRSWSGSLRW